MPAPSPAEGLGLTLGVMGLRNMGTDGPSGSLGLFLNRASLVAQKVKNLPAMQKT